MGYGVAYASQRSIAIKLQTILHRLIEIPDRLVLVSIVILAEIVLAFRY